MRISLNGELVTGVTGFEAYVVIVGEELAGKTTDEIMGRTILLNGYEFHVDGIERFLTMTGKPFRLGEKIAVARRKVLNG